MDQRVKKIQELMQENLGSDLSLQRLAEVVNLSVWRLSHIFRANTGRSPIQYLKALRLAKARDLLETSFLSVKEITHLVGLNDESHFVRDFKKTYGVPPTNHRALFRNGKPNESAGVQSGKIKELLVRAARNSVMPLLPVISYWLEGP